MLVCRALIKVIGHKELLVLRNDYSYLSDLEKITARILHKYENKSEDGVGEMTPKILKQDAPKQTVRESDIVPQTPRSGKTLEISAKRGRGWHMKAAAEARRALR